MSISQRDLDASDLDPIGIRRSVWSGAIRVQKIPILHPQNLWIPSFRLSTPRLERGDVVDLIRKSGVVETKLAILVSDQIDLPAAPWCRCLRR